MSERTIRIVPWVDPIVATLGHDARSLYCELFYLPTLGPSTLFLLRRLATMLEHERHGFDLSLPETARALGLGDRESRNSPLWRSLCRLIQFDLAREIREPGGAEGPTGLEVRPLVPPVNRRHLRRLPEHLQAIHDEWTSARLADPPFEEARRNARRLASTLLAAGEDLETVERALFDTGFHPAICRESAIWAADRHGGRTDLAITA